MLPTSSPPHRHAALRSGRTAAAAPAGLRVLRAVPFATVCVVVSALGHSVASDCVLPPATLLTAWLGVLAVAAALAGRERGLPAITGGLAAGQLGLHLVFHFLSGTAAGGMSGDMAGMGGMGASGGSSAGSTALDRLAGQLLCGPGLHRLPHGATAAEVVRRAGLDPSAYAGTGGGHGLSVPVWFCSHPLGLGLTPAMVCGHLLAAAVAGWWLRRGELAFLGLIRRGAQYTLPLCGVLALAAALLGGRLGLTPQAAVRPTGPGEAERPLPRGALLRHVVSRRGPPCAAGRYALAC
jgi:hypothetical protein